MAGEKERFNDILFQKYIFEQSKTLINNKNFIKKQTFNFIKVYSKLFSNFLINNKDEIEKLLNNKNEKNSGLKKLSFLRGILFIIKIDDNEVKIREMFLNKNFKIIKSQRKADLSYESWKDFSKKFKSFEYSNYKDFTVLKLYNFANSILTFLNDEKFRKEVAIYNLEKTREEIELDFEESSKKDIQQLESAVKNYQNYWKNNGSSVWYF